jgi:hypothetical protein
MKDWTLKIAIYASIIAVAAIMLTGCLPGDGTSSSSKPAGFLWGIWHGWIAPISLIVEIFRRDIRIYEPANAGFWYDLGYYMAVIGGFGSLSLARRNKKRRNRD